MGSQKNEIFVTILETSVWRCYNYVYTFLDITTIEMINVPNVYNYYYTKLIWINHFKCSSNMMPPTPKHNTTSPFFSSSKWWTTIINGSGPWENGVLIAQQILERTYLLQGDHGSQICFPSHFSFEPPLITSLSSLHFHAKKETRSESICLLFSPSLLDRDQSLLSASYNFRWWWSSF